MKEPIACLGAGRMGRGIAVVFAYAGHNVSLVDFKARDEASFTKLSGDALREVRNVLATLAGFGLFDPAAVDALMTRVSVVPEKNAQAALSSAAVIFEGVPEVLDLKREALARASKLWDQRQSSRRRHPRSSSTISRPSSIIRSASSTRTGSIRPFSCRWSRSRPAGTPTPRLRRV
jgi:hypothetical protein